MRVKTHGACQLKRCRVPRTFDFASHNKNDAKRSSPDSTFIQLHGRASHLYRILPGRDYAPVRAKVRPHINMVRRQLGDRSQYQWRLHSCNTAYHTQLLARQSSPAQLNPRCRMAIMMPWKWPAHRRILFHRLHQRIKEAPIFQQCFHLPSHLFRAVPPALRPILSNRGFFCLFSVQPSHQPGMASVCFLH